MRLTPVIMLGAFFAGCIPHLSGGDAGSYRLVLDAGVASDGSSAVAVPRESSETVMVAVFDANGLPALINYFEIDWRVTDTSIATVTAIGPRASVTCHKDFFDQAVLVTPDAGFSDAGMSDAGDVADASPAPDAAPFWVGTEPETVLTASYGGSSASIRIVCVINAAGDWHIDVDEGNDGNVTFTQTGRSVENRTFGVSGDINGNIFSYSAFGYDLVGAFQDRSNVSGTYVNNNKGTTGTWTGQK